METNYNNCPFKLTLPIITEDRESYKVNFQMIGKIGINNREFILSEMVVEDGLKNHFRMEQPKQSFVLKGSMSRNKVEIIFQKKNKNCFFTGTRIKIVFWDLMNHQEISIHFLMYGTQKGILEGVVYKTLSDKASNALKKGTSMQQVPSKVQAAHIVKTEKVNPFVERYRRALQREIDYLRNEGGRQHKVTNGKLISAKVSEYVYSFELESELHLPDAAPFRIKFQSSESNGEILICEDFSMTVILKQHIGENIPVAYITVEPWKLLNALVSKLEQYGNGRNFPIAKKLIDEGPYLAKKGPLEAIKKGQKQAASHAKTQPITVIWGPPGTGKTYTLSQLALDFISEGKRVLIVSHSNVSVDGVINKIVKCLEETGDNELLEKGRILRYGYVRDESLSRHPYATSFNYCMKQFPELFKQKEELEKKKLELKSKGALHTEEGIEIQKKIQHLRLSLKVHEKEAIKQTMILATTISKIAVDSVFDAMQYDVVMFDEVSMAYVPQIFMAACSAKQHFICVGDFRQLPPIAQSENKEELEEDIFTFLRIVNQDGEIMDHPWLVMLNVQRRMHHRISAFASRNFYSSLLKSERQAAERIQMLTASEPFAHQPIIQIDLTGTYCAAGKNSDNSRFNILSAFIAFYTALDHEKKGTQKVGIITPYAAQMRLVRAMIEDYREQRQTEVICSTVHQFQGSEKDVILFDAIESYPFKKPGVLLYDDEHYKVTRLINVAVTRAKGKLLTISHNRFWMNKLESKAHPVYKLLKYEEQQGKVLTKEVLKAYLEGSSYEPLVFWKQTTYLDALLKDIRSAQESIKISLPSGHLSENEDILGKALLDAIQRGIRVGVKCNAYAQLPKVWKKFSVGCENAIFPLIIIDGKVTWYGVPMAQTAFEEGNSQYRTIVPLISRFKGKRTTEMIQGLTEIDEVITGSSRKPLLSTMNHLSEKQSILQTKGLLYFIEETYRCKECKEPLTLKKSRAGKSYIGCTKCNHMEYLTPELVNHYIQMKRVICPEHKQLLTARLGQYGVYIQCSGSGERHYLKADEI